MSISIQEQNEDAQSENSSKLSCRSLRSVSVDSYKQKSEQSNSVRGCTNISLNISPENINKQNQTQSIFI